VELRHPDYTLTMGAQIPCVTVNAINSGLGGYLTCRVPDWVNGTTGHIGLLPPGTLIFGQVQSNLQQGQERLGVAFTRIETAGDHMLVPLSTPGADAMGRTGLPGQVSTHFWETVGDVALYALIDGAQQAIAGGATAAVNGSLGGKFGYFNLNTNGQSLAQLELGNRLNRPPTIDVKAGQPITVWVNRDLDFYKVCRTRQTINPMACPERD
jgi:type IV secretion system protein VirB10